MKKISTGESESGSETVGKTLFFFVCFCFFCFALKYDSIVSLGVESVFFLEWL